jgi:RNase H-fold protein (predicted Holliday junction resolvase)
VYFLSKILSKMKLMAGKLVTQTDQSEVSISTVRDLQSRVKDVFENPSHFCSKSKIDHDGETHSIHNTVFNQLENMSMLIMSPTTMLVKLVPLKSILCIVRRSPSTFGIALSDPYLGHAFPLQDVSNEREVEDTIAENGVGALLLALPMTRTENDTRDHDHANVIQQRTLLLQHKWNVPLACISDERLPVDEARLCTEQEVEMWEDVDLDCPDVSTDAAVALNRFLWTHTGGWQNTFG